MILRNPQRKACWATPADRLAQRLQATEPVHAYVERQRRLEANAAAMRASLLAHGAIDCWINGHGQLSYTYDQAEDTVPALVDDFKRRGWLDP